MNVLFYFITYVTFTIVAFFAFRRKLQKMTEHAAKQDGKIEKIERLVSNNTKVLDVVAEYIETQKDQTP